MKEREWQFNLKQMEWAKNEMKRNGGRQEELRQKYYFIWGYIKS